jgi:hypothetical protein
VAWVFKRVEACLQGNQEDMFRLTISKVKASIERGRGLLTAERNGKRHPPSRRQCLGFR